MKDFKNKLNILKITSGKARWEDLTDEQRQAFRDSRIQRMFLIFSTHKCFYCKMKFDKSFIENCKLNYEFLAHIKQTHGLDPEIILVIIRKIVLDRL